MIGKRLAHYEILEKIGEGGMGEVYRARDTQLGREVAIKILPEVFSADPDRLARFEREARLLASVNHPGIAVVHGLHEEHGMRFLAMELVPGEDLAKRIAGGPVGPTEAMAIAFQVAQALEAAHEQGVIHRDLKPSNIMLTPDGRAKVLDFGLAKSLDVNPQDLKLSHSPTLVPMGTMQGVILGTAAYMSPEQARGKPVDRRCDIWSFGVIVFEMLTGKQLFAGETVSDTMAEVLKMPLEWGALPAETPPHLTALLRRCLDRDPGARLRDIGEARIALAKIQAGDTGLAAAVAAPAARPGFLRAWGGWIAAALLLAVALFAFLSRESSAPAAGAPLRKSTIELSREDSSLGDHFTPAISPDGRYVAYVSRHQLWVRDLAAVEPRLLAGTEEAINPFWSPDAAWIGYGRDQAVRKIPREGGSPSLIANLSGSANLTSSASSGSWSGTGRVLVTTGVGGVLDVSAQGGDVTTLVETAGGETDFHELALLPGDKGIVFVVHDSTGIGNIDVRGPDGVRRKILDIEDSVEDPNYSPSGHIVFRRNGDSPGIWAFPFSPDRLERTGDPFLVAAGGFEPSVSRDGALVYVTGISVGRGQMVVVDRKGVVLDEVGPAETVTRPYPEISPDDRWVLHAVNTGDTRELYRYDLSSHNRQRLTFNDMREGMAAFHPNGRDVLFFEDGEYWTYLHPLEAAGEPRRLVHGIMAVCTRDGSQVVFSKQQEKGFIWNLCRQDLNGGEESPVTLVANEGINWFPQLSPNERYVAYASDESGHEEVYVTTYPTPTVRWQVSTGGGSFPRWRGDGWELYYTTRDAILVATVNTEGAFSFTPATMLFQRPHIDWSSQWYDGFAVTRDGQRFVLFRPVLDANGTTPSIVVVQNWFEEFKPATP